MSTEDWGQTLQNEQEEHHNLVDSLVRYFENKGFRIQSANQMALSSKYRRSERVGSSQPDVIATDSEGRAIYGKAVGCRFLDTSETIDEFRDLSSRGRLYVIVPSPCVEKSRAIKEKEFASSAIEILYL
jgi:hypothetical protein